MIARIENFRLIFPVNDSQTALETHTRECQPFYIEIIGDVCIGTLVLGISPPIRIQTGIFGKITIRRFFSLIKGSRQLFLENQGFVAILQIKAN